MRTTPPDLGVELPAINQISFAVDDLTTSMEWYGALFGIELWQVFHLQPEIHTTPAGEPHEFSMDMALPARETDEGVELWRETQTELELACPREGESYFTRFLEENGNGLHHVACWELDDYDETVGAFEEAGYQIVQESQVFGSSQYCYVDTRAELDGIMLELAKGVENGKPSARESDYVEDYYVT